MWGLKVAAGAVAAVVGVFVLSAWEATQTCHECQDALDNRPHSHH